MVFDDEVHKGFKPDEFICEMLSSEKDYAVDPEYFNR